MALPVLYLSRVLTHAFASCSVADLTEGRPPPCFSDGQICLAICLAEDPTYAYFGTQYGKEVRACAVQASDLPVSLVCGCRIFAASAGIYHSVVFWERATVSVRSNSTCRMNAQQQHPPRKFYFSGIFVGWTRQRCWWSVMFTSVEMGLTVSCRLQPPPRYIKTRVPMPMTTHAVDIALDNRGSY